jgi:hypothetical protein
MLEILTLITHQLETGLCILGNTVVNVVFRFNVFLRFTPITVRLKEVLCELIKLLIDSEFSNSTQI